MYTTKQENYLPNC